MTKGDSDDILNGHSRRKRKQKGKNTKKRQEKRKKQIDRVEKFWYIKEATYGKKQEGYDL